MSPNSDESSSLLLGVDQLTNEEFKLPVKALKKHISVFGQSGSGKTVACKILVEEAIRNNIPAIIIDPQGDISSLALFEDYEILKSYGVF
ncbi:MAG: helicase HerA domain-containing protein [Candidatus Heimdallarchaeaceae archaeon]